MSHKKWNTDEQLLALRLYCALPFGKLHQSNPDVIAVANAIGRTRSAVAMKACNFASLDPALNRKGLGNVSNADRQLWDNFASNSEELVLQMESIYETTVTNVAEDVEEDDPPYDYIPRLDRTDALRLTRVRTVQSFFRKSVLVSYGYKCCLTGLDNTDLIVASHIIPWKDNVERRADPTNGLALNVFHDKLFDRGLMTFDDDWRVRLSPKCADFDEGNGILQQAFDIEGKQLMLPERFCPDLKALQYHRSKIFKQ